MEEKQKPSIGRIVHFNTEHGKEAALIVAVHNDECINLVVWNAGGSSRAETSALQGSDPGRWEWPARV